MSAPPAARVRDAVAADAPGIARVHVDAWRETYAGVLSETNWSEAASARRLAFWRGYLALDPRPGRTAVAVDGEQVVGFANAGEARGEDAEHGHVPARDEHLFSIYVLAARHGRGVGRALLEAVLGSRPAQLWVLDGNERALAFYERAGFRADGAVHRDPRDARLVERRMVR